MEGNLSSYFEDNPLSNDKLFIKIQTGQNEYGIIHKNNLDSLFIAEVDGGDNLTYILQVYFNFELFDWEVERDEIPIIHGSKNYRTKKDAQLALDSLLKSL